jgi:hypothetical protein
MVEKDLHCREGTAIQRINACLFKSMNNVGLSEHFLVSFRKNAAVA